MGELQTQPTDRSVDDFLKSISDEERRKDCSTVLRIMKQATGKQPKMWGDSIVGFGTYHYIYASGRAADWFLTGFSPRKQNLTLYVMTGFKRYDALLRDLGKYKTGKSCLYIKRLADVDLDVLTKLIGESVKHLAAERS